MAQQAEQFGRGMTLDEQRRMDQVNQERNARAQQAAQFGRQMDLDEARLAQQESQFGRGMTLDEARLAQQGEQFGQQMTLDEQRLAQQGSQFDRSLAMDEAGLTGMYEGRETQQAQQQFLENERARMAQLVSAVEGLGDEEQRASFARRLMSEGVAQGRFEGVGDVLYNPSYRVGDGGGGGGGYGGVRPVYSTAPGGTTVTGRTVNPRTLSQEEYDEYERRRRLNIPAAEREW